MQKREEEEEEEGASCLTHPPPSDECAHFVSFRASPLPTWVLTCPVHAHLWPGFRVVMGLAR